MNSLPELVEKVASFLKEKQWKLAAAESCTGGLVAGCLTDLPGSSAWFDRGFITYSNQAKTEMLGVSEALLVEFGAVSEAVVLAMAQGALYHSSGEVALAVTGIAGPDGGSIEKPVGTVWFAWISRGGWVEVVVKRFEGNRREIRKAACEEALVGLMRIKGDLIKTK